MNPDSSLAGKESVSANDYQPEPGTVKVNLQDLQTRTQQLVTDVGEGGAFFIGDCGDPSCDAID